MLRRLEQAILVVAALGILYSGPLAACVCADPPPASMPCCADDPQPSAHADHHSQPDVQAACDPLAADALPPSSPDFPQTLALWNDVPLWLASDPPARAQQVELPPYASPPIYLVTLRLRN
jgi:hypothetical protein